MKNSKPAGTLLILGAGSDIAHACAGRWAQEGWKIMLTGRKPEELERRAADLRVRFEAQVSTHFFDARDFTSHSAFVEGLPDFPDITLCAFGYLGDQTKACTDWSEAQAIIESNYTGAVSILNRIAEKMIQHKKGCIIGISSVAGDRGRMSNYHYGSAKAGFTAYLSGLRNRLAHEGLHVLTVKPGFVRTQMTAGLPLPAPLTAEPQQTAQDIYKAWKGKKNTLYTLWMWKWIMLIIQSIPEPVFKKLKL